MCKGQFTWWNRRKGDRSLRSKLDRSFGNFAFTRLHVVCCVDVIPTISSDHHSLILLLSGLDEGTAHRHHRPEQIEPWWLADKECCDLIREHWIVAGAGWARDLLCSLEDLKAKIRDWSFKIYGVIPKEINLVKQ